jgi:hypothetical protein
LRHLADDWGTVLGAAALLAAAGAFYWLRRRAPDPEEIERLRRSHLNQVGRIVEGHVVELLERPPEPPAGGGLFRKHRAAPSGAAENGRRLVCYSYSISGVSYETAQDITGLEERLRLDRLVAGQSASVEYDPSNPSNSILVADDWSGLH